MRVLVRLAQVKEFPVGILFGIIFFCFLLRAPGFVEARGLIDCARQYSCYAVLAVGLTLVIAGGGIDISVGSVVGFSAVVLGAALSRTQMGLGAACLIALASGSIFGLINGMAVARMGLQPVVVTLSTMAAARGLAYVVAGPGISSISLPERATQLENVLYNTSAPVVLAGLIAAAGWLVLTRTGFGRSILATGGNERAAWLSGIDVPNVKTAVYLLSGTLAGLAGVMTAGMMSTATTDAGLGYEFEAITAVLMGGTSITGGEATVVGTIIGVATAATISRGFGLLGISDLWRMMCLGLILIASVLVDKLRRRMIVR